MTTWMVFIENPNLLIHEYNQMVDIAQRKAFITIGIEIQKAEVEVLENYRSELAQLKKEFVDRRLENEANLVFCIDRGLEMISHELEMLIAIKEDRMSEAWGHLVNAQTDYSTLMRVNSIAKESMKEYGERLQAYESILFPPMIFSSVGGVVRKSICSICEQDFSECNHEKGKLYMGEHCVRIVKEMDIEEVSIVENPANKHCRMLSFEHDGKNIDFLTLREST